MTEDMKSQLAKYLKADGYYDIMAIRIDLKVQGYVEPDLFDSIFAGVSESDVQEAPAKHPLWQAAIDANEAKDAEFVETTETVVEYWENEDGSATPIERKVTVRKPKTTPDKRGTLSATGERALQLIATYAPKGRTQPKPIDGYISIQWLYASVYINHVRPLVVAGLLENMPHKDSRVSEQTVRLTPAGIAYATERGWLAAQPIEPPPLVMTLEIARALLVAHDEGRGMSDDLLARARAYVTNHEESIEFAVDVNAWRNMVSWVWMDKLRHNEYPIKEVAGETLRAGDTVDAMTHILYRLLEPVKSGQYFGRDYTLWRVVTVNTPKAHVHNEMFYDVSVYRVLGTND